MDVVQEGKSPKQLGSDLGVLAHDPPMTMYGSLVDALGLARWFTGRKFLATCF